MYLYGDGMRVSSLSLLPAWMLWHVPVTLRFYCVHECTYLQLGLLICTRYSCLTQCTAFLKRRVDFILPACARMCVALICKMNADPSIKADLACVLPTDMLAIITWSHCNFKGTTSAGTWTETYWLTEQLYRRRRFSAKGRAVCNHWNMSQYSYISSYFQLHKLTMLFYMY